MTRKKIRNRVLTRRKRQTVGKEADVKMCMLYSEEDKLYGCTMIAWGQGDVLQGFRTNFKSRYLGAASTYTLREYVDKDLILELELCVQHEEVIKETITTSGKVIELKEHLCDTMDDVDLKYGLIEGEYERVLMYRYRCSGCGDVTYDPPRDGIHHVYKWWTKHRDGNICGQWLEEEKKVLGFRCKRCGREFLNHISLYSHLRKCVIARK